MGHTFKCLYFHFIWSTKLRKSLIKESFEERLYQYMKGIVEDHEGSLIAISGMPDHVHILVQLNKLELFPALIRNLKSGSSRWVRKEIPFQELFSWQEGYGNFTVSHSFLEVVKNYILNQKQHHQKFSFKQELETLLKKHNIPFDKRYIFD